MHRLLIVVLAGSLAVLPACAVRQMETTEPTVSYTYDDDDDYVEVAERADEYCEERYGEDATLVGRGLDGRYNEGDDYDDDNTYDQGGYDDGNEEGSYRATFACR